MPERVIDNLRVFEIGSKAEEVAPVAMEIVRDRSEYVHLRKSAAYLLDNIGSEAQLRKLQPLATRGCRNTRDDRDLVSVIIRALYRRGIWDIFKSIHYAPSPETAFGDTTAFLERELLEGITVAHARKILGAVDWSNLSDEKRTQSRRGRYSSRVISPFTCRALEVLIEQKAHTKVDYELFKRILLVDDRSHDLIDDLGKIGRIVGREIEARRTTFLDGLNRYGPDQPKGYRSWQWLLGPEDVDWLADLAEARKTESPWLFSRALSLCYGAGADLTTLRRIRKRVREFDPTIVQSSDKNLRHNRRWEKRRKSKRDEAQRVAEAQKVRLKDEVDAILAATKLGLRQKLHMLSRCCFGGDFSRPSNLVGQWMDLGRPVRMRVFALCMHALSACRPTRIPDDGPYPGTIIWEGDAFGYVVENCDNNKLTDAIVKKWLASTMIFSMPDRSKTMASCHAACPEVTEDVIYRMIRRELRGSRDGIFTAINLPTKYWSERLIRRVLRLVANEEYSVSGRSEVLRVLASRAPDSVKPIAFRWLESSKVNLEDYAAKRLTAIDVLLGIAPTDGLLELEKDIERRGIQALLELRSPRGLLERSGASLSGWGSREVERLYCILRKALPPLEDPERECGTVFSGPRNRDDLIWLRGALPRVLFDRDSCDDRDALTRLRDRYDEVSKEFDYTSANQGASTVLKGIGERNVHTIDGGRFLDVQGIVRFLDDAEFHLIRTDSDLAVILVQVLLRIAESAPKHTAMLYQPRCQPKRGVSKARHGPGSNKRRHLPEDALQAYLHCRLSDLLPDRVLEPDTQVCFLDREVLAGGSKFVDIKVQAPTVDGSTATVIIEIKWSDNKETSFSQREQLVEKYMIPERVNAGVYFVGWTGKGHWSTDNKRTGVCRPMPRNSRQAYLGALRKQAISIRNENPGMEVHPMVVDLTPN